MKITRKTVERIQITYNTSNPREAAKVAEVTKDADFRTSRPVKGKTRAVYYRDVTTQEKTALVDSIVESILSHPDCSKGMRADHESLRLCVAAKIMPRERYNPPSALRTIHLPTSCRGTHRKTL